MKIAVLTPTFLRYSGIDRVAEQNIRKYLEKKNDVTLIAFQASMDLPGAKIREIGMPKSPFWERLYRLFFFVDIFKIWKISSLLKSKDVVISHQYPMNIIAWVAKKRFGVRYIYYDAGIAPPETFSTFGEKMYIRLFRFLTNLTARGADEAISISEFLQGVLKKETGLESKVRYVEIDSRRFHKNVDNLLISEVKQKHKLGKNVMVYTGRVSPHKGIHILIDAFKIVKKALPDAQLVIIGKHTFGNYSEELKKNSPEGVIWAGFVTDERMAGYYAASTIYVTASLWEGFDMPAVEAQACGKRVVAFTVGSHPEVIKSGTLVREQTAEKLAQGMLAELTR